MVVKVMTKQITALIPPHTRAVVASSLALVDADLAS